jgi:hypothetical protein
MSEYFYYELGYDKEPSYMKEKRSEVIVQATESYVTVHGPSFASNLWILLYRKEDGVWEKMTDRFIVIDPSQIRRKKKLGFGSSTDYPPGFFQL